MRRCALGLLLIGSLTVTSTRVGWAQEVDIETYVVEPWTSEEGLPQNSVLAITQTKDGYLWLGTFDGLVRFDGTNFDTFTPGNSPGMTSGNIRCLYADGDGRLWIGTDHGGALLYQDGQMTPVGGESMRNCSVYAFVVAPDGNLLIGTSIGLFRRAMKTGVVTLALKSIKGEPVRHLHTPSPSEVYLGSNRGLHRLNPNDQLSPPLWTSKIESIQSRPDGQLFVTTSTSGKQLPGSFLGLQSGAVQTICEFERRHNLHALTRSDGRVWLANTQQPLSLLESGVLKSVRFKPEIPQAEITSLYIDFDDNLWVGTDGQGLMRVTQSKVRMHTTENGLVSNNTTTIAQDAQDRILIGSFAGGLVRGDSEGFDVGTGLAVFRDTVVVSLLVDSNEDMWVGTEGQGLQVIRNGTVFRTPWGNRSMVTGDATGELPVPQDLRQVLGQFSGPDATVLFRSRSGDLWVGTRNDGARRYRSGVMKEFNLSMGLSASAVTSFAETPDGTIWIGTRKGLNRVLPDDRLVRGPTSVSAGLSVHSLFVDKSQNLWIGSAGAGLGRYYPEEDHVRFLTRQNGIPNDVVAQILEDDFGSLWIGTNGGIGRLSPASVEAFHQGTTDWVQTVILGTSEGLGNAECTGGRQPACVKAADGHLWFCTVGGVVEIRPEDFAKERNAPVCKLRSIRWHPSEGETTVVGTPEADKPIVVPPNPRMIEVAFTGLNFANPAELRFRYRLVGYDSTWVSVESDRIARYPMLPPGEFQFECEAINHLGIWSPTPASVSIIVTPAWWETNWFAALTWFFIVGLCYGAYLIRVNSLKKAGELQVEFTKRTVEVQERERRHLASDLHDGVAQEIAVIRNHAIDLLNEEALPSKAHQRIAGISDVAASAMDDVRSMLADLRPRELDQASLSYSLRALVSRFNESRELQTQIFVDGIDGLIPPDHELHVYRIVQEALNNASKHAEATKTTVRARVDKDNVEITVEDNGRGMKDTSSAHYGFGLQGIKERARWIQSEASIEGNSSGGLTVRLQIPTGGQRTNSSTERHR